VLARTHPKKADRRDCIIGHFGDDLDMCKNLAFPINRLAGILKKSNFSQVNNSYK